MKKLIIKMQFDGADGGKLAFKWNPENYELQGTCEYRQVFDTEDEAMQHYPIARKELLDIVGSEYE